MVSYIVQFHLIFSASAFFYRNFTEKFRYFEQIGEADYVSENLNDVMKCNCYRNCKSLNYMNDVHSSNFADSTLDDNNSYVNFSVFYKQDAVVVYRTTVRYTLTDLMGEYRLKELTF